MNKFGILFCFLLAVSNSAIIDGIDVNDLYEKIIYVARGMTTTSEYRCVKNLSRNKATLLSIIEGGMAQVKAGKSINDAVKAQEINVKKIAGIYDDCNAELVMYAIPVIASKDGFDFIGSKLMTNNNEISALINQFTAASDLNGKLEIAGKILSILTTITLK